MCWWPTPEPVAYLVGVLGVGKISVTLSRPPVGVLGVPIRGPVAVLVCVSGARVPPDRTPGPLVYWRACP